MMSILPLFITLVVNLFLWKAWPLSSWWSLGHALSLPGPSQGFYLKGRHRANRTEKLNILVHQRGLRYFLFEFWTNQESFVTAFLCLICSTHPTIVGYDMDWSGRRHDVNRHSRRPVLRRGVWCSCRHVEALTMPAMSKQGSSFDVISEMMSPSLIRIY